jgi:hypothetical protein
MGINYCAIKPQQQKGIFFSEVLCFYCHIIKQKRIGSVNSEVY